MVYAVFIGLFSVLPMVFHIDEELHSILYATYCVGIIIWATIFLEKWR
jgi:hypothetical protein